MNEEWMKNEWKMNKNEWEWKIMNKNEWEWKIMNKNEKRMNKNE